VLQNDTQAKVGLKRLGACVGGLVMNGASL